MGFADLAERIQCVPYNLPSKSIVSGYYYTPANVKLYETIGGFNGCTSLEKVVFGSNVTSMTATFYGCVSLVEVVMPENLESINMNTFSGCTSLTTIEIPEGVTTIGKYAFQNCSALPSINLPNSLTSLDKEALMGCSRLAEIIMPTEGDFAKVYSLSNMSTLFRYISGGTQLVGIEYDDALTETMAKWDVWTDYMQTWSNPGNPSTSYETVVEKSNEICAGLTTDVDKVNALSAWIMDNISYLRNANNYAPTVLESGIGDCDGYSNLFVNLLRAQGIPAYVAYGTLRNESHAWTIVLVDGTWRWIEPQNRIWDVNICSFFSSYTISYVSLMKASAGNTPSDWAKPEVWDAICADLVPGDMQANYVQGITREAFCRLMIALVEQSSGQSISAYLADKGLSTTDPFGDTDAQWVLQAYALGLVNGTSDTTFSPENTITRQEASAMLARTATLLGATAGTGVSFTDSATFATWASESIGLVSSLVDPTTGYAVMGGTSEGAFAPTDQYSVEQAILTALRLYHAVGG